MAFYGLFCYFITYLVCPTQFIDSIPDMASSNTQDTQDFMLRHPGIFEEIMLNVAHRR